MAQPDLIVFAPSSADQFSDTLTWLSDRGWKVQASNADALENDLRQHRRTPLLIYSPPTGAPAADIVSRSEAAIHGRPVVVAVDQSDFGAYYELMALGVNGYYEVGEGPEPLDRALRQLCPAD